MLGKRERNKFRQCCQSIYFWERDKNYHSRGKGLAEWSTGAKAWWSSYLSLSLGHSFPAWDIKISQSYAIFSVQHQAAHPKTSHNWEPSSLPPLPPSHQVLLFRFQISSSLFWPFPSTRVQTVTFFLYPTNSFLPTILPQLALICFLLSMAYLSLLESFSCE